jgi:cell shape-determining protein MreC
MNTRYLPLILVGLIIGKVTENSARILVEFDQNIAITGELYNYSINSLISKDKISISRNFQQTKE